MPGKYPLITAPSRTSSPLSPGGSLGLSQSSTDNLKKMFPNSPIYYSIPPAGGTPGTAQSDSAYRAYAVGYLQPVIQAGDADQFPSVNMDYSGSPNLKLPLKVGGVDFDSPYYPNRSLAGVDPAGGEGAATGVVIEANDNYGTGAKVNTYTPSETAAVIAASTINVSGPVAPLGKSGNSTKTTHDYNDGSDGVGVTTLPTP